MVVNLLDEAHVGRNHAFADLVAGEVLAVVLVHERPIDRVRVLALHAGPHRGHDVITGVHGVVGIGGNVGPVGLDVAQVQAPAPAAGGLLEKFDGPVGGERGLRMRLGDSRRQAGVAHVPAAHAAPVLVDGAVRVQFPRVVPGVALAPQVVVVAQTRREDGIGVDSFQLLERLKAAAHERSSDSARRIHSQAGKPGFGAAHVRLADEHRRDVHFSHVVAEGQFTQLEGAPVRHHAVGGHVAPGVDAGPGRPAQRRLAVGAGEPDPAGREPVDVRCLQVRMAVAGQVVPPELVAHDEQDVGVVFQVLLRCGRVDRPVGRAGGQLPYRVCGLCRPRWAHRKIRNVRVVLLVCTRTVKVYAECMFVSTKMAF